MDHILQNPRVFATAGKAIFTIQSGKTGSRYTYRINKADDKDVWFVSVLTGSCNTSDYTYIGVIGTSGQFYRTKASKVGEDAPSFKAFDWFWKRIENLPEVVSVYHEGRCGRCGRMLTVPESIESGFGPECVRMLG